MSVPPPDTNPILVGEDRTIKTWNDDKYHKLREACGVPDNFLQGAYQEKDFKPGNCLAKDAKYGKYDALYDLKGCADDKLLEEKGKSVPTVHKRIWHLHMWGGQCMWSDDRKQYFKRKMGAQHWEVNVPEFVRDDIHESIKRDVEEFLIPHNLMDYSLVVGEGIMSEEYLNSRGLGSNTKDKAMKGGDSISAALAEAGGQGSAEAGADSAEGSGVDIIGFGVPTVDGGEGQGSLIIPDHHFHDAVSDHQSPADVMSKMQDRATGLSLLPTQVQNWQNPFVYTDEEGATRVLSIGLIDFLQKWVLIKKVAMCIKVCERNKATIPPKAYGERFVNKFSQKIHTKPPKQ